MGTYSFLFRRESWSCPALPAAQRASQSFFHSIFFLVSTLIHLHLLLLMLFFNFHNALSVCPKTFFSPDFFSMSDVSLSNHLSSKTLMFFHCPFQCQPCLSCRQLSSLIFVRPWPYQSSSLDWWTSCPILCSSFAQISTLVFWVFFVWPSWGPNLPPPTHSFDIVWSFCPILCPNLRRTINVVAQSRGDCDGSCFLMISVKYKPQKVQACNIPLSRIHRCGNFSRGMNAIATRPIPIIDCTQSPTLTLLSITAVYTVIIHHAVFLIQTQHSSDMQHDRFLVRYGSISTVLDRVHFPIVQIWMIASRPS